MDLVKHLRYFVAVAEELHFGRAAERLHISQPPLSQRIRALEERVGTPLLTRTSRRVELTPAGRRLLPEARALVDHAAGLERAIDELAERDLRGVRVGLPPDLPATLVGALLRTARDQGTEVEIVQGGPAELDAALRGADVDVAVLHEPLPPGVDPGERFVRPRGVLLDVTSPLAGRELLNVSDLLGLELVLGPRESGPAQHDELLTQLGALGCVPAAVHVAEGAAATAGVVLAGRAVAVTERPGPDVDGVAWRPLAEDGLVARVAVASRPDASAVAERVAELTGALLVELDGWARAPRRTAGPPRPRPSSGLAW